MLKQCILVLSDLICCFFQILESVEVSSELVQLLQRMLAKKPDERITLQEIKVNICLNKL